MPLGPIVLVLLVSSLRYLCHDLVFLDMLFHPMIALSELVIWSSISSRGGCIAHNARKGVIYIERMYSNPFPLPTSYDSNFLSIARATSRLVYLQLREVFPCRKLIPRRGYQSPPTG